MIRPNSSYSKTFLTRRNYRGPTLLRTVLGRNTALAIAPPSDSYTLDEGAAMGVATMKEDDLEAIYAPPLSSDDEDGSSAEVETAAKRNTLPAARTSSKRQAHTAASSRSKRRKLKDEPSLESFDISGLSDMHDPYFLSSGSQKQSSQKRKLQQTYAHRKSFERLDDLDVGPNKPDGKQDFVSHEVVKKHNDGSGSKGKFLGAAPLPGKHSTRATRGPGKILDVADLPSARTARKGSDFQMPELPDITSSAATSATDIPSIFEEPIAPRHRSGSTSSLSSANSMFILENEADLMDQFEQPFGVGVCCPICQKPVHDSESIFVPDNLRSLSFKQQQTFCSKHQVADAKELYRERGYPRIDWEDLEKSRIPKQMHLLKKLINRQTTSVYLDELDEKIKAAKGNRKAIRQYLANGVVDVAQPGYYGPKGTRIMVTVITDSLTDTLKTALGSDSVLRAAGVGGYVSAVLVPELTLQLVMSDMRLSDAAEGRRILNESTKIGVLLNPDDDHIERDDDDDDDDADDE
ncbi:hypothetical protein H2204_000270 [Knufia peltigerae]|uniref:Restriction of telomere capping protein 4 n=1 Tax=Knufia peltigerae TaxID=1002370 RepID=A0AA38YFU3_9EURO|nr:hypothetical protein H2204_000270 [Knufia peltigerae]